METTSWAGDEGNRIELGTGGEVGEGQATLAFPGIGLMYRHARRRISEWVSSPLSRIFCNKCELIVNSAYRRSICTVNAVQILSWQCSGRDGDEMEMVTVAATVARIVTVAVIMKIAIAMTKATDIKMEVVILKSGKQFETINITLM